MTFIMIMMWLEPLDQYHTSESPLYSLIFTTVIGVLVLIGVLWARRWLMKKSPLVAMIDMQSQSFAVIEYYSGRIKGMKPCNELILYLNSLMGEEADSSQIVRIGVAIEVREPGSQPERVHRHLDFPTTIQQFYDCDTAIASAALLMAALPWKGIEGDVYLIDLWQERENLSSKSRD